MRKPTIKDVAKKANVSIATISRVLNKTNQGYSEKTEEHVLKTIQEMAYSPNAIARGLINKKSGTIGVIFPDISGLLSAELLKGIETNAQLAGTSVIVCNTYANPEKTIQYLHLLNEKQVDGVLFVSQHLSKEYEDVISHMKIPFVAVSSTSEIAGIPEIKVHDEKAAYDATNYLLENGHTNIGMISGCLNDSIAGSPRANGFRRALADAGLPFEESKIQSIGFRFKEGQRSFRKIMHDHPDLTAIFAASDELAAGALSEAYQMGIRIPDDLSIIGYDNTQLAIMLTPPLTTVSQQFEKMGATAVDLLLNHIQTGEEMTSLTIQHEVIVRQTVKKR